jgi:hypothetical protein
MSAGFFGIAFHCFTKEKIDGSCESEHCYIETVTWRYTFLNFEFDKWIVGCMSDPTACLLYKSLVTCANANRRLSHSNTYEHNLIQHKSQDNSDNEWYG